jgi:transposase
MFRYGLIVPLVAEVLPKGELTRRAEEIAARRYDIPASKRTAVSVDTLLRWAMRYRKGGLGALAPQARRDRGQSRAITPQLAELIDRLKRQNPHLNGVKLHQELARTSNLGAVSVSTLYRFLKERGLLATPPSKNFEAELSNQSWQMQIMLGPCVQHQSGDRKQKHAFLFAFMDSASRLIAHAQFYTTYGSHAMLDCLRQAVAVRGLPIRLHVDHCKLYQNRQVVHIANSLDILLVHTGHQPQEREKIERCFRCIREECLASLGADNIGLPLAELNERLWNWIDNVYHRRELCSLETTPLIRWQRDIKHVRRVSPNIDLSRLFSNGHLNRAEGHHSADILPDHSHETSPNLVAPTTELGDSPVPSELRTHFNGPSQGPAPPVCPVKDAEVPSLGSKPNRRPIDATTSSGTSRKWPV